MPDLVRRLRDHGQERLADALDGLEGPARARLAAQVQALDLGQIQRLVRDLVLGGGGEAAPGELGPAEVVRLPRTDADRDRERRAREAGEEALREGAVAAVLLAGGQGTRLGFAAPKGMFPFAPVSGRTLFAQHAASVEAVRARYGCDLPWYLMTSPQNDEDTREFLADCGSFGLPPDSVQPFVQGTMPAVDLRTGDILREAPDRLALSPDGHGGLLAALRRHGLLDEMRSRGIRVIYTFQVDNPLVRVARPELIGHHLLGGAQMSSVVVAKTGPSERMGVVATVDGRTAVVEYSDLPDELAEAREPDGGLRYWAGSIAVHCIDLAFAERLTGGGLALPFHRAVKKVRHVDDSGSVVDPAEPNAVKFETFIFDALPLAERTVTVEAERGEEFSPIKNAEGADSPASAARDVVARAARWLAAAGVAVPRDPDGAPLHPVEIDPRLALDPGELAERVPPDLVIGGPTILGPERLPRG
jgi:UDP-N-acetylglucosamine/UDP-N-acetylgalactosamine diphosphorylase